MVYVLGSWWVGVYRLFVMKRGGGLATRVSSLCPE